MHEKKRTAELNSAMEVLKESGVHGLILPSSVYPPSEAHLSQLRGLLDAYQRQLIDSNRSDKFPLSPLKNDGLAPIPQINSLKYWYLINQMGFTPHAILFGVRRLERKGPGSEQVTMRPGELLKIVHDYRNAT